MADFISALTGVQMDQALLDMAEHNSEAYAVGERNGIAVASDDVTYHNNARYYAQIASSQIVGDASSAVRWDTDQSEALTDEQKAQARENIDAASDSDVVKITAQTLTSAEQAQARANIMAGGSNPNLLDNPFFTVNQREFTSSTEVNGLRIVDRWFINSGGGTVTLTSNGLSVDNTQGTRYNTLQQIFGSGDWLAGETVTLSINDGGTIYHQTFVIPAQTSGYQTLLNWSWKAGVQLRFYVLPTTDQGAYNVQIYCQNGASSYKYDLRSAKLESGSVSTLANDVPPDYDKELDHCKWYFERIKAQTTYSSFGNGFGETTTSGQMQVPMHPKRTVTYTVSTSGSFTLYNGAQSRPVSALSKATSGLGQNVLCLAATATSLVQGSMYALLANNDASAYIDISADL